MKTYLKHYVIKMDGRVEIRLHALSSALYGGEWSNSRNRPLYPPGKRPRYPLVRRLSGTQIWSGPGGGQRKFFLYQE